MTCPICGKDLDKERFVYYSNLDGRKIEMPMCLKCGDRMSKRLDLLARADKNICETLGLDFFKVTDYEEEVRHRGKFHREIGLEKIETKNQRRAKT